MVKQTIQIYLRIKPSPPKAKSGGYLIDEDGEGHARVTFHVPKELQDGLVNNRKDSYKFRFDQLFDVNAQQDGIFDSVARPVIDNVLGGYNGTIFAYGQTGSGKTFTITGGAERYADRGIIPRTLSYIYDYYEKNPGYEFSTNVSYLEIYNESGFDLLDPRHEAAKLEDLPKVTIFEDGEGNIHLKNLSIHSAANEEEALNLLFVGDTNRMIAETPMNQASTRSHCIFSIHVTCRQVGSATIRRAKLHLVDLAGSERVSKSGVNGLLLTEAKYINLSLHYLEQVIVALSERNRSHIPYRNSMMTSVLRDSLGGNCMTSMIATGSIERKNLLETISTCRFAQRVAMIKNDAILNEEIDPHVMISRLRKDIDHLKAELQLATGEQRSDDLTAEEVERCEEAVKTFLNDRDENATLTSYVCCDMRKIHCCCRIIRRLYLERPPTSAVSETVPSSLPPPTVPPIASEESFVFDNPVYNKEVKQLREIIHQRDTEINILVNMLKKEKRRTADALGGRLTSESVKVGHVETSEGDRRPPSGRSDIARLPSGGHTASGTEKIGDTLEQKAKGRILGSLSMGREEAFELFKRDYPESAAMEEHKELLKRRYTEAKTLGQTINSARNNTNQIKASIERHRMQRVLAGETVEAGEPDDREMTLRSDLEREKGSYREAYAQLKSLKTEIEHLQHMLERDKVRLVKDFEAWWSEQCARAEKEQEKATGGRGQMSEKRGAWKTPPQAPPKATTSLHPNVQNQQLREGTFNVDNPSLRSSINSSASTIRSSATVTLPSPSSSNQSASAGPVSNGQSSGIPLTGDPAVDADILAFMQARERLKRIAQQKR